ncbi:MAG: hypothetical protein KatS3mg038_2088 [Candidatus Kapaibacterium sp.]|nr:MAG: hypothetical protein KatS3mg038_2088 [Candidatus Kapabacteria bacterium]
MTARCSVRMCRLARPQRLTYRQHQSRRERRDRVERHGNLPAAKPAYRRVLRRSGRPQPQAVVGDETLMSAVEAAAIAWSHSASSMD